MKPSWKFVFAMLGWLVVVVVLVTVAVGWENRSGEKAWEASRKYLEAEGEVLDLDRFAPPPVPDEENFCATPLLAALFAGTGDDPGPVSLVRLPDPRVEPDFRWMPSWLAAKPANLPGLAEVLLKNPAYPVVNGSLSPAEQVLFLTGTRFHAELTELAQAARRPHAQPPWHYGTTYLEQVQALQADFRHFQVFQDLQQLMLIRTCAALEAGHPDEALESLTITSRMSEGLRLKPGLLAHMVRFSSGPQLLEPVWQGLVMKQWRPDQLDSIQAILDAVDLRESALRGYRTELIFSQIGYPDYIKTLGFWKVSPPGIWDHNKAYGSRRMYDLFIRPLKHGTFPVLPTPVPAGASRLDPHRFLANRMSNDDPRTAKAITYLDLARIGCAVERHAAATGHYPETLSALVPAFLPTLPTDFYSHGVPFHYRLLNDGTAYVIYSPGTNGTDDGGVPGSPLSAKTGDWVWTNLVRSPH